MAITFLDNTDKQELKEKIIDIESRLDDIENQPDIENGGSLAGYTAGTGINNFDFSMRKISVDTDVIATKKDINTTLIKLNYNSSNYPNYWSYPEGVSYSTIRADIENGKEVSICYSIAGATAITRVYQLENYKDNEMIFGYHLGSTIEALTLYSDGTIKRTTSGALTFKTDFDKLVARVTTLEENGGGASTEEIDNIKNRLSALEAIETLIDESGVLE